MKQYVHANIDLTAILVDIISGKSVCNVSFLEKVCII